MSRKTFGFAAALGTLVASISAGSAGAQVRQYTPPGGAANESAGREEALVEAVEEARWNLGRVRVDPALWISDLSWVDDPDGGFDPEFTGRAGAGLRAYLPVGGKTTLAAFALPEYVWHEKRTEDNRLNQHFGLGVFTYFNRLSIEVGARRNEDLDYVTSESFQKISQRSDVLQAAIEIPVFSSISIYAGGEAGAFETLAESPGLEAAFENLDRDDRRWNGGLRWYPTDRFHVGGGVGRHESDFADEAVDRSNSGDYWYAETGYERPKLSLSIEYQNNELEGEPGSEFGRFEGSTGSGRVEWRPRDAFAVRLYGHQTLSYSLGENGAFVEDRLGIGFRTDIGWRLSLDLFFEKGKNDYDAELDASGLPGPSYSDDVEDYGAFLFTNLSERFVIGVGYRHGSVSTPLGLADREIDELRGTVSFGLGGGAGSWY